MRATLMRATECKKRRGGGAGVRFAMGKRLRAVLLDACRAQAGEAVPVDRVLPREEFLDRDRVAGAGFLEREETATHGRDHLGLAADDPAFGVGRRQVRNRERTSVRPDDVL